MKLRAAALVVALAVAAGCGRVAPLRPAEGEPLPIKPLLAQTTPTAEELLTPPTGANPQRVDELLRRSQPRSVDRFDLPPAGVGSPAGVGAPPPVLGTDTDEGTTNEVGPATPE